VARTAEEMREISRKGGRALQASLTPEERGERARHAIAIRWAKHKALGGTYPRRAPDLRRVEWHLKVLAQMAGNAALAGDAKEARACIQAMLGAERLKIWIARDAGKPGGPVLEIEGVEGETEKRLKEAKARRNKALGLDDEVEIVVENKEET
jgi:hypothetical protein